MYSQLQEIHLTYLNRSFEIIGFPSNSFNHEKRSNCEILQYLRLEWGVEFDLYAKVDVNGPNTIPLYHYLKRHSNCHSIWGERIKWNFTKFLIGRDGAPIKRYGARKEPFNIELDIQKALEVKKPKQSQYH